MERCHFSHLLRGVVAVEDSKNKISVVYFHLPNSSKTPPVDI